MGARLNPGWDDALARERIRRLGLDLKQRAGRLSGGQRAQLALTLGIAKRPELLILDEPVAALDPLARREFMQDLMEAVAEHELSVVLSSHLVSDVERACDYVIVLVDSRVQVAGDIDDLVACHHRLTGPRRDPDMLETGTHYLAWNQGVTRTRWLAIKLGLGAAAAMTAAGLTSLAVSSWSSPIDRAVNGGGATDAYFPRLDPVAFAARDVVPMAHAAFAFVLGVALGLVIRRPLPAMATTLVVYAAVQISVPLWLRPYLAATDRTTVPIEPGGAPISIQEGAQQIVTHPEVPGAWVTSQQTLNAAGQPVPVPSSFADCLRTESGPPTLQQFDRRVADLGAPGYQQQVTYHQQFLGPSMGRDRALPRSRPGPDRVLRLVDPPPTDLTRRQIRSSTPDR